MNRFNLTKQVDEYDRNATFQPSYLCMHHVCKIQASENHATNYWNQVMRLGAMAYTHCKTQDAKKYLGAAVEICILRIACKNNKTFTAAHILKPLEILIEIHIQQLEHTEAFSTLSKISTELQKVQDKQYPDILDCLAVLCVKVNDHEKLCFTKNKYSINADSQENQIAEYRLH